MAVKNLNHHLVLRGVTWHFVTKVNGKKIKKALSQSITEARRLRDDLLREVVLHGDIRLENPRTALVSYSANFHSRGPRSSKRRSGSPP